jgi:peptidoglycan/LPS O-acetylase OafA/YrhL
MVLLIKEIFKVKPDRLSRFTVLDGIRGFLAISVVFHHTAYDLDLKGDYSIFKGIGYWAGVIGFFVLSSFLLTYRLFVELENENAANNGKTFLQVIIHYFLRRLFRIYLAFMTFCTVLKQYQSLVGGKFKWYTSWFSLITLQSVGFNHLWTVGKIFSQNISKYSSNV